MVVFAVIMGVLLGAGLVGAASLSGLHRERAFYAGLLIAIAFFYPVFAWERFALDEAALQLAFTCAFAALAVWGYRKGARVIAIGFVLHGGYGIVGSLAGIDAPLLWPDFCLALDFALAAGARVYAR